MSSFPRVLFNYYALCSSRVIQINCCLTVSSVSGFCSWNMFKKLSFGNFFFITLVLIIPFPFQWYSVNLTLKSSGNNFVSVDVCSISKMRLPHSVYCSVIKFTNLINSYLLFKLHFQVTRDKYWKSTGGNSNWLRTKAQFYGNQPSN